MKTSIAFIFVAVAPSGACNGARSYPTNTPDATNSVDTGLGSSLGDESAGGATAVPSDGGLPQRNCQAEPSPTNTVVPVFGPIFTGSFSLINHFDHDEPKEFTDHNGHQIDWCGRRRTSEIDGHSGYDFRMPEGTPLLAPADGIVNWAGDDIRFFCPLNGREITDQLRVEITHSLADGRRVTSNYKHLSRVDVHQGQQVLAGATIGLSGNTGCSLGPHLHFENWLMDGTRTGNSVLIDAYGWEGDGPDPWAGRTDGAASMWLWKPGEAPDIFTP